MAKLLIKLLATKKKTRRNRKALRTCRRRPKAAISKLKMTRNFPLLRQQSTTRSDRIRARMPTTIRRELRRRVKVVKLVSRTPAADVRLADLLPVARHPTVDTRPIADPHRRAVADRPTVAACRRRVTDDPRADVVARPTVACRRACAAHPRRRSCAAVPRRSCPRQPTQPCRCLANRPVVLPWITCSRRHTASSRANRPYLQPRRPPRSCPPSPACFLHHRQRSRHHRPCRPLSPPRFYRRPFR